MVEWSNAQPMIRLAPVRIPGGKIGQSPPQPIAPQLFFILDPGSNPSNHELPPPYPPTPRPPQKWYPVSGIQRPRKQRIPWVIVLLGKIMILQGVGHPTSCLGVCHANDPQKGGVYGVQACA